MQMEILKIVLGVGSTANFWSYWKFTFKHMIRMWFSSIKKNLITINMSCKKKKQSCTRKNDLNPKITYFSFFDINSNKVTYTCPRLINLYLKWKLILKDIHLKIIQLLLMYYQVIITKNMQILSVKWCFLKN